MHVVAFDAACLRGKADADPVLGYELMRRFIPVIVERLQATRVRLLDVYGHVASGLMAADPMLPISYVVADKRQELGGHLDARARAGRRRRRRRVRPGPVLDALRLRRRARCRSRSAAAGTAGGRVGHTVRAVGAATSALCSIEPGDQLGVRGPFGNSWPLDEAEGGDVVVVAGGIGLAPLRPAIEHLIAKRDSLPGGGAALRGALARRDALPERAAALARGRDRRRDHRRHARRATGTGRVGPGHQADPERRLRGRADHGDGLRARGDDALRLRRHCGTAASRWTASTSRWSGT